MPDGPFRIDI